MRSIRQAEPRDQILDTALAQIDRDGLTVGLDHLSLEKIIRASGVSRATAYRIWPNKQQFLADVIVAAVRATRLSGESEELVGQMEEILAANPDFFTNPATRRNVIVTAINLSAQEDFERLMESPQWTSYLALAATARGLPAGPLRTEVTEALIKSDDDFATLRAIVYSRLPRLIGYRLVGSLAAADGFRLLSQSAGALMTGWRVKAGLQPSLMTRTFRLAAFGAREQDWTEPSYSLTAHLLTYLEPDPDVVWDEAQVARFLATVDEIRQDLTAQWASARPDGPAPAE